LVNVMHAAEVPIVLGAQSLTPVWLETVLKTYTEWIHPASAFTIVAPLLFGVGKRTTAVHLLLVAGISDLTNLLLKWTIAGDRPYWVDDRVRQFPMTCEAGYGMPSGHVQAFTTVTYFLLMRWAASRSVMFIHTLFVLTGAFSRVYTGAHFPTQTIAGWAVGATFGIGGHYVLSSTGAVARWTREGSRARRTMAAASLLAVCVCSVIATYLLLVQVGFDPLGSMPRARAACVSSRGPIGLVFQSATRALGIMAGAVVVIAAGPLGADYTRGAPSLTLIFAALAVVLVTRRLFDRAEVVMAANWADGGDGPISMGLAAISGLTRVVATAPFTAVAQLAGGAPSMTKKR